MKLTRTIVVGLILFTAVAMGTAALAALNGRWTSFNPEDCTITVTPTPTQTIFRVTVEYEAEIVDLDGPMTWDVNDAEWMVEAQLPGGLWQVDASGSWEDRDCGPPDTTTTTTTPTTTTTIGTTTTTNGGTTTTQGTTTTTQGTTTTTSEPTTTTSDSTTTTDGGTTTTVVVNPICIDCNNATVADLMQLTGVDEELALDIIANRPYETLTELVTKGVMTPAQLLLILVVNIGTGAFAGPECLNAVIQPPPTTTTLASSTTIPGATTTTIPTTTIPGITTTVPGATTTVPGAIPDGELPRTGTDVGDLVLLGILLVVAGGIAVVAIRQPGERNK